MKGSAQDALRLPITASVGLVHIQHIRCRPKIYHISRDLTVALDTMGISITLSFTAQLTLTPWLWIPGWLLQSPKQPPR
jgi:hypothetical protein